MNSDISSTDAVLGSAIYDYGDIKSIVLFYLTYISSIASAAFGCTKCLKVGVAATIRDEGPFEGLCSGRFFIAFCGKFLIINECFTI